MWKYPYFFVRITYRDEGSGWGTHVYLWRIHVDIWQNQDNIVKLKNKRITCKERWQGERLLSKKAFRKRIKVLLLQVCREDSCYPWDSSSGLHPGQHASSPPSPTRATIKIFPRFPLRSFLMLAGMNGWIDGRMCSSTCLDNLAFKGRDFTGHRSSLCHRPVTSNYTVSSSRTLKLLGSSALLKLVFVL